MWRTMAWVAVGIGGLGGLLWAAFAWSFRTKFRPVQDRIRRFNRDVTNPRQLQRAGQPGSYASIVHHTGRTTGTAYRTPVVAVPTEDGFVFALPYGPEVDWARNVRAAGTAMLDHDGRRMAVHQPTLVDLRQAAPLFPAKEQRMHRAYGVQDFLRVQVREPAPSGADTPPEPARREARR